MKRRALLLMLLSSKALADPPASIDNLLTALKSAPTEEAAAALEAQIRALWTQAATPAVRLLLSRARREMSEGAPGDALDSYDAALDLQPNLLEGWRGRAEARRALGDYVGAVHDCQELLKLEPRSFLAFKELAQIAEARRDWRSALAAWRKVLELSPHTPGGQPRLQDLERRAYGEEL